MTGAAEPAAEPLGEASKPPRTTLTCSTCGDDLACHQCDREETPECSFCFRPLTCLVCDAAPDEDRARTFVRWLAGHGLVIVDGQTGEQPAQLAYLIERLMRQLAAAD